MSQTLAPPSVRDLVRPEEWQLRTELAAAYRLVATYRWDDLVFTHLSARVPGPDHHFLINPFGLLFEEVTASSLVKVDLAGNKVMESPYSINPAGFVIHSAIHAAREDARCVMHVHTRDGVAVAAQKGGLLPISQQASVVLTSIAYHDYEGLALTDDEKPRLVADLGSAHSLVLRNHGLLTCGSTVGDAFGFLYLLQRACEIQIAAQTGGGELIRVNDSVLAGMGAQVEAFSRAAGSGLAWSALVRKLDRSDPSYRD